MSWFTSIAHAIDEATARNLYAEDMGHDDYHVIIPDLFSCAVVVPIGYAIEAGVDFIAV